MTAPDHDLDLLAFAAHPDDVELFCGGVLARAADQGHATGIVDLTRGELASLGSPEERAREAAAAGVVLGLRCRDNLGLPDTALDPGDRAQLAAVVEVLRRRRPALVLAPWLEDRHPDHAAAGELVTRAVFYAGVRRFATAPASERFVPDQLLYYQLRHRMAPSFVVDTSAAAARKAAAIACHASQLTRPPGADPTLLSGGDALAAIEARDRYVGSLIGVSHGEALRGAAVPGLADLVGHFRANRFAGAHAFEPVR